MDNYGVCHEYLVRIDYNIYQYYSWEIKHLMMSICEQAV